MTQDFSGRILKVTGCSDWSYHTSFLPTVDRGNVWSCITWRGLGFEEEPARCWRYWCPGLVTCLHETRTWQIYTTVWRTSKLVSSFRLMNFESYFIDVIYVISFFYSIPCLWDIGKHLKIAEWPKQLAVPKLQEASTFRDFALAEFLDDKPNTYLNTYQYIECMNVKPSGTATSDFCGKFASGIRTSGNIGWETWSQIF